MFHIKSINHWIVSTQVNLKFRDFYISPTAILPDYYTAFTILYAP